MSFAVQILSGLSETLAKLMVRQQTEKTRVYVLLKQIILSATSVFGLFFLISIAYQMGGAPPPLFNSLVPWNARLAHLSCFGTDHTDNWHLAWMNEGSFAVLNFFIVVSIMYLWRPTANNLRYASL